MPANGSKSRRSKGGEVKDGQKQRRMKPEIPEEEPIEEEPEEAASEDGQEVPSLQTTTASVEIAPEPIAVLAEANGAGDLAAHVENVKGQSDQPQKKKYGKIPRPSLDLLKELYGLGKSREDDSAAARVLYAYFKERAESITESDVLAMVMVCHLELKCGPDAAGRFFNMDGVPKKAIGFLLVDGDKSFVAEVVNAKWEPEERFRNQLEEGRALAERKNEAARRLPQSLGTWRNLGKVPKNFPFGSRKP